MKFALFYEIPLAVPALHRSHPVTTDRSLAARCSS